MTDRDTLITQLADDVRLLTEPREHTQPYDQWTKSRNRKFSTHVTRQPSLLAQLRVLVVSPVTEDSTGRSVPGSRTPEGAAAFDLLESITEGAAGWAAALTGRPRLTVRENLTAAVGAATGASDLHLKQVALDVAIWLEAVQIATGWEDRTVRPYARCPHCERLGTLRLKAGADDRAWCVGCGAVWSRAEGTIGLLADHIRAVNDTPTEASG